MNDGYLVNEIFYSIQGEGHRVGEASVFVRMAGCNLRCSFEPGPRSPGGFDCDTEFESWRRLKAEEVVSECLAVADRCRWVVLTGGEPALQADPSLLEALHGAGFKVAVETNGAKELVPGFDWVTLSPKVAEHAVRVLRADELKYVRGHGQGIPRPAAAAAYKFLSPAFAGSEVDPRALDWCVRLVKENPEWRLTAQMHKLWKVR